jgi:hypothetical protein
MENPKNILGKPTNGYSFISPPGNITHNELTITQVVSNIIK